MFLSDQIFKLLLGFYSRKDVQLITPHECYFSLGKSDTERQRNYSELFKEAIPDAKLEEIRCATSRAWVLGEERFVNQIVKQTGRKLPLTVGGDRKSVSFNDIRYQRI